MKRIDFISTAEFEKLYKAEKDKSVKLAMLLMFGSGLRISEVLGLEKEISSCCKADLFITSKINTNNKKVQVLNCSQCKRVLSTKDIRRKKGDWKINPLTEDKVDLTKHQIRVDEAKGGKWRITVTSPILKPEMLKLLPINIPRRTFQRRIESISKEVLGKKISVHTLRHGFGNYAANVLNLPLPMVQSYMGHSKLETTGIYTKVNPEHAVSEYWKKVGGTG